MYHSSVVEKRAELADQFPSARPSAGLLTTLEDQTSDYSEQAPDRGMERLDSQDGLVAFSSAMRDLRRQIEQIATTNAPVLLLGELGTGKELVARAIHKLSGRSAGRFMKVNCAAQLSEPLDSGDEAHGFFDAAEDDTLFLHKVTEMPISTQTKLLNLLGEDGPSLPGNAAFCGTHARLISATRENIRKAAESGILRPDLYYRLSVFTLRVPPLRERGSDLPHLLSQLMDTWAEIFRRPRLPITRHIMDVCASYAWPGNLRELENFVKRYLVLGEEKAALDQLESGAENPPETSPGDGSIQITLPVRSGCLDMKSLMRDIKKDAERAVILQALERTRGNKQKAARLLRISLRSLHYKVRAYQVDSMRARDQSRFEIAGPVQHQSASGSASPYRLEATERCSQWNAHFPPQASPGQQKRLEKEALHAEDSAILRCRPGWRARHIRCPPVPVALASPDSSVSAGICQLHFRYNDRFGTYAMPSSRGKHSAGIRGRGSEEPLPPKCSSVTCAHGPSPGCRSCA